MKRNRSTAALVLAIAGLSGMITFWIGFNAQAQQLASAPAVPPNVAGHAPPAQPIPFNHRTHLALALACESCHSNTTASRERGLPAATACMACHSTIAAEAPAIRELAAHAASDTPIGWLRVYEVLPGVTWSHGPHLAAGVECTTCHGNVAELEVMRMTSSVTAMASCIGCHESQNASTDCTVCHAWPAAAQ